MLTQSQQFHTLLTARHFGGFFVSKLADAGLAADSANRDALFTAFPALEGSYGPSTLLYTEDLG